jgi:hypothetical protein
MQSQLRKIFYLLLFIYLLSACGNNSSSNKKVANQAAFDIGIDTSALNNADALLAAARKYKEAKQKDEDNKKADPNYEDHYLELLKMETLLTNKASSIMGTLPANESVSFYDKFKDQMK